MHLQRIWLTDFRSYAAAELELPPGLCALVGDNGQGKSNILEAVAYLSSLESFRGAPSDALIRTGSYSAVVRGEVVHEGREQLIEAEINRTGRNRVQLNRQRVSRARDLLDALRVTVFAPDDLELLKGGPQVRRQYLDRGLVLERPPVDAVRSEFERALKQRNALLKQARGRLDESAAITLDVWDSKFVAAGDELYRLRTELCARLAPYVTAAYRDVAGAAAEVDLRYQAVWNVDGLGPAVMASRDEDVRRGLTLVGPHRDELAVNLDGLPSRTHASQGEQRALALALRLGVHRLVTDRMGTAPVLLLDDVLSELDHDRASALLSALPVGQTLISSATGLPSGVQADLIVGVTDGELRPVHS